MGLMMIYIFFIFDTKIKHFNFQNGLLELDFLRGKSRIYETIIFFLYLQLLRLVAILWNNRGFMAFDFSQLPTVLSNKKLFYRHIEDVTPSFERVHIDCHSLCPSANRRFNDECHASRICPKHIRRLYWVVCGYGVSKSHGEDI